MSSPVAQQVALGNNPGRSREHNRRVVLDVVRRHGALGRMEIARLSQLTAQAIANIVDELVAENLLMRAGRLRSGRGQPPVQFVVNPDGGMTVGVELAADHVALVVLDLTGKPRDRRSVRLTDMSPQGIAAHLRGELRRVRREIFVPLLGVGVVMPGPFQIDGLTSVGPTTLPGWSDIDPTRFLSEACGERVLVENDANAAAVGERLFGAGQSISNFCMIYFGAGVGLGMIHDGAPYRGAFGNAGEIGHVVVDAGGKPCPCGQRGCLERYASRHVLDEELAAAGVAMVDVSQLERLHAEGNPVVDAWLSDAARRFGPIIAMMENLLDPQTFILGGALPDALIDDLIVRMAPLPISVASRRARTLPRTMRGRTGHYTAALGAASLPLFNMITPKLETSSAEPRNTPPQQVTPWLLTAPE